MWNIEADVDGVGFVLMGLVDGFNETGPEGKGGIMWKFWCWKMRN